MLTERGYYSTGFLLCFWEIPYPDGERIRHDLARVVEVCEAVDDGNGTILGQIKDILVSERARGA